MTSINQNLRTNEQIRISPVRLIGPDDEQLGIVDNHEALRRARDLGLDLVEVAPNARPPVCRMMNYGKWKYNQKKKGVKKSHEQTLKEVRLRPKTDTHDRDIKMKRAIKFLMKGHKVQFTMVFRGRERSHREIGFSTFQQIVEFFGQRVKVERAPSIDGRLMVMVLAPVKGAFDDIAPETGPDDDDDDDDHDDHDDDAHDAPLLDTVRPDTEDAEPADPSTDHADAERARQTSSESAS